MNDKAGKKSFMEEFRAFVLRGNVVDLAVGVVMGAAFGAVVTSLVTDVLTPLLGVFGTPDFKSWAITLGKGHLRLGLFLNSLVSLVIIGLGVFIFVIKPLNRMTAKRKSQAPVEVTVRDCPQCLSSIPKAATRCAFCTAEVSPVAGTPATGTP
jgi:large conductance mechanosensitive channel